MQFLRTPDARFQNMPDYDYEPHYLTVQGGRMHYIDAGAGDDIIVGLHGEPSWAFLYRHIFNLLRDDFRVIAPDMLGFGRSDKPAAIEDHTFHLHYGALIDFIEQLDLQNITLLVQDWGGLLGLPFATHYPQRIRRLVVMNTGLATGDMALGKGFELWQAFARRKGCKLQASMIVKNASQQTLSEDVLAAYDAPFPDESYRAGVAALPLIVPSTADMPGAAEHRAARERLQSWQKPTLVLFSDKDPITSAAAPLFRKLIPAAQQQAEITIEGAGHFLQEEKGAEIARHVRALINRTSA